MIFDKNTVILGDSPLMLIDAMYRYYEKSKQPMTIGELYLILKLLISKIEDDMENKGINITELINQEN